ncbi:hypothetical protein CXG81DRAFT_27700 [Caulochytrium protostelioides]|uniref:Uncharacterized protein n=1 Tax=Caulochytrium protostelioides TaxID=1555241 RepID=A0A4P9X3F3_9FUNG|nr:hypothetical protein CXG81DRAFT_27700 [Caulochytrium protostelioides]|eukprot:RKO99541.1 hypothetical protein CXG81DRAFT_27700 [Caulochytrium protostelioides]
MVEAPSSRPPAAPWLAMTAPVDLSHPPAWPPSHPPSHPPSRPPLRSPSRPPSRSPSRPPSRSPSTPPPHPIPRRSPAPAPAPDGRAAWSTDYRRHDPPPPPPPPLPWAVQDATIAAEHRDDTDRRCDGVHRPGAAPRPPWPDAARSASTVPEREAVTAVPAMPAPLPASASPWRHSSLLRDSIYDPSRSETPSASDAASRRRAAQHQAAWAEARRTLVCVVRDLGAFLPLVMLMAIRGQVSLSASLLLGGLCNVLAALAGRAAVPVQPMAYVAALALDTRASAAAVRAAGLGVAVLVGVVGGLLGAARIVRGLLASALVRGLQLSAGLLIMIQATEYLHTSHQWRYGSGQWVDTYAMALAALVLCLAVSRWFPNMAPTVLLLAGLFLTLFTMLCYPTSPLATGAAAPASGPVPWRETPLGRPLAVPLADIVLAWPPFTWRDVQQTMASMALGQLPLTLLTTIAVATPAPRADVPPRDSSTTWHAFPSVETRYTSLAVVAMNAVAAWFGGVPLGHGTADLPRVARTPLSLAALGIAQLLLGAVFGATVALQLGSFPHAILAVILLWVGLETALSEREAMTQDQMFVMIVTGGTGLAFKHGGLSLGVGVAMTAVCLVWPNVYENDEDAGLAHTRIPASAQLEMPVCVDGAAAPYEALDATDASDPVQAADAIGQQRATAACP